MERGKEYVRPRFVGLKKEEGERGREDGERKSGGVERQEGYKPLLVKVVAVVFLLYGAGRRHRGLRLPMVTDEQILSGLETLLSHADLSVTTSGDIRQQLEHKFGVDLSHRRAFIREHIDLIVQSKRIPYSPHHHQRQHQHQLQPQFHHLPQAHGHAGVSVGIPSYGDLVDIPAFDPNANYGCSVNVDMPRCSVAPEMPKDRFPSLSLFSFPSFSLFISPPFVLPFVPLILPCFC